MTLDNFQLPPFLAEELYKDSLVDLDGQQIIIKSLKEEEMASLGSFKKNILVIVNDPDAVYLTDENLQFFIDILTACKLSLSDIAVVNSQHNPTLSYNSIQKQFKPRVIILLGIDLSRLQFPLGFPEYQVLQYNNQQYLSAPSLSKLAADKQEKLQLWNCLKKLFAI